MPGLLDAVETLQDAISAAINANPNCVANGQTYPGQTVPGWAVSTDLAAILGQGQHNHLVVIWPTDAKNTTRYSPYDSFQTTVATGTPSANMVISGSNVVTTFSGAATSLVNVAFLINGVLVTVSQQTPYTLASLASACATAIIAAAIPGVGASAVGAVLTITGAKAAQLSLGGLGSVIYEVGREMQGMMVTVYAAEPFTRFNIGEAIKSAIGTAFSHSLTMSDGNEMFILRADGGALCEKAQSSYSAYEWHIPFNVEYPLLEMVSAYQVVVVELTEQIDNAAPKTSYIL